MYSEHVRTSASQYHKNSAEKPMAFKVTHLGPMAENILMHLKKSQGENTNTYILLDKWKVLSTEKESVESLFYEKSTYWFCFFQS